MNLRALFILTLLIFLNIITAKADLILPHIFSDHMVLQQKSKVNIWGWASPAEPISLSTTFFNRKIEIVADSSGEWMISFRTPSAGGPHTITLEGYSKKVFEDVYIGEVWIASGQSNMEMPVDSISRGYSGALNFKQEVENADFPLIRQFDVNNRFSKEPEFNAIGEWKPAESESMNSFSATAYFFAKNLHQYLDVPIGIINATWGGTPAQAWIKGNDLRGFPNYYQKVMEIDDKNTEIKQNYPSALYNGMLAPMIPYTIKGAIWYQGEANIQQPDEYHELMTTLIESWRDEWNQGHFPFYFVQIAPFDYQSRNWFQGDAHSLGRLIEAQARVLSLKNTAMAHTSDIGNARDIHPKNKQEVGKRLAYLALDQEYKSNVRVSNGPILKKTKVKDDHVLLYFDQEGSGLTTNGDKITGFEIATAEEDFQSVEAEIVKEDRIQISLADISKPKIIRYAYSNTSEVNLFNKEGFPARPFSIVLD